MSLDLILGAGVLFVVAILVLRFVAPLTKTVKDDDVLKRLEEVAALRGPGSSGPNPSTLVPRSKQIR